MYATIVSTDAALFEVIVVERSTGVGSLVRQVAAIRVGCRGIVVARKAAAYPAEHL